MKSLDFIKEGQIYSTGGGPGEGQRWYKPRSVPNQNELDEAFDVEPIRPNRPDTQQHKVHKSTAIQLARELHTLAQEYGNLTMARPKDPRIQTLQQQMINLDNEIKNLGFEYEPTSKFYIKPLTVDLQQPQHLPKESAIMKGLQTEQTIEENLRKWFKEKWVRFGPDGKIRGACARGDDSEGKPKCLPQAKAHALGKKGRKYAAAKKRREDPNPERRGPAKNVATKKKSNEGVAEAELDEACWKGYHKEGMKTMFGKKYPNCVKNKKTNEEQLDEKCWDTHKQVGMKNKGGKMVPNCVPKESVEEDQAPMFTPESKCPHCGGKLFEFSMMNEKKDACYYKVKSRYKVWPSAYASGALVKCRKKGASNWGTGGKKNENAEQPKSKLKYDEYMELANEIQKRFNDAIRTNNKELAKEIEQERIALDQRAKQGLTLENLGTPYPGTYEQETAPIKSKGQKRTPMIAFETTQLQLDEKWSEKYKKSINCNNPKGFSQRAHCQGRKKK